MKKIMAFLTGLVLLILTAPAFAGDVSPLAASIKAWAGGTTIPQYKYALVDLNDDGVDDAIVLITDRDYCGTGGCTLVILRGVAGGFRLVSSSTVTREPILLLQEKHHGWHTLSVSVSGGGVKPGQVLMRFSGTKYPRNPSVLPIAKNDELKSARTLDLIQ